VRAPPVRRTISSGENACVMKPNFRSRRPLGTKSPHSGRRRGTGLTT
jgi:hypothetical protein